MNNSPLLPDALYATPVQRSIHATPLGSATALPLFSPPTETLRHARSVRRLSTPIQLDPRLFQPHPDRQVRRSTLCGGEPANRTQLQGLLSPSHLAKVSPRISFSYKPPLSNARSQLTTLPTLTRHLSSCNDLHRSLLARKKIKCRLSSNQFSFVFAPARSNKEDYTLTSIKTIPLLDQSQPLLAQPQEGRKAGCESKMASTIASSGFPLRVSDFSLEGSSSRQKTSQIGQSQSSRSIFDSIPSKQLGRTVMLPSHYSFGGLLQQSSTRECQGISREWQWGRRFQLCGGEMKESIHCGPELRSEHKFQMLGGYGREIKESTTSFSD